MTQPTDVGVVGAGIVGLSAAYAARRLGLTVTVYDAAPPGSGQSAGQSRVFRHAHDDPRLVDLAIQSRRIWRTWEEELGVGLVSEDGAVALGTSFESRLEVMATFPGLRVRRIDAAELAERQPLLAPYQGPAIFDEDGGSIRTVTAVRTLSEQLRDQLVADRVLTLRSTTHDTVEVRSATGRHEHGHVLVCAGRGTPALARGMGVSIPVRTSAHGRVSFAVASPPPSGVAALQDTSGDFGDTGVYGAAYPDNDRFGLGVGANVAAGEDGHIADPTTLAAVTDRAAAYVARALPGLDPNPVDYVHCWVTELPWAEDGIGVWEADGVSFVAGHNLFKHAPALGTHLADRAGGEPLPADLLPEARLGEPR